MSFSYYGGKGPQTYHIVYHFDSVYDMVQAFNKGGSFTDVLYGQYVIIDTIVNKDQYNNPQNGLLYRRGLNYQQQFNNNNTNSDNTVSTEDTDSSGNKKYYTFDGTNYILQEQDFRSAFSAFVTAPGGGAEYVGQIVGPKGDCPEVELLKWEDFQTYRKQHQEARQYTFDVTQTPGATFNDDGSIKQITDDIKYGYCTIKDQHGNVKGVYLAFDFPYTVFKFTAQSVSPYGGDGYEATNNGKGNWSYSGLVSQKDQSIDHPFFKSYDIKVPIGIHGQNIKNMGINLAGGQVPTRDGNGDIIQTDAASNYRIYYTQTNFDNVKQGQDERYYIGWQRTIDRITDDGQIGQNAPTLETLKSKLPVIKRSSKYSSGDKVRIDNLSGDKILIATCDGTTSSDELQTKDAAIGTEFQDGTVIWRVVELQRDPLSVATIHYTHGNDDKIYFKLLSDIQYDDNGKLYAKYTNIEHRSYVGTIKDIIGVGFDNSDERIQRLFIKYNTYSYDGSGNIVIDNTFQYDNDGNIAKFPTTDDEGRQVEYIDQQIKFVTELKTDEDTQDVYVVYNNGQTTKLGNLKAVKKVYWNNDFNLVIQYNTTVDGAPEEDVLTDFDMKYIDKLYINDEDDLSKEKKWNADFIVGKDAAAADGYKHQIKEVSTNINEIKDIKLYGDNLVVLWSDPTKRNNLAQGTYYQSTWDDGKVYRWENLGPILAGTHIYGDYASLDQLKADCPYGLDRDKDGNVVDSKANRAGWVVSIKDGNAYHLYAYDYIKGTANAWYQIQDLSSLTVDPKTVIIVEQAGTQNVDLPVNNNSSLSVGGYWFVVSE